MRNDLIAVAVVVVLFCALYGLFWALATPYHQPAPKKAPTPEMKAPQRKQVWA
jgi:hypothetical protein